MKKDLKSSKEYFFDMANNYPTHVHPLVYKYKIGLIKEFSHGIVLDVGCADGHYLHAMREYAIQVIGIDHTSAMITTALFKTRKYSNVSVQEADILNLPFQNGIFDVIFCQSTFYYVKEQQKALIELWRVLKLGGTLIIDVRYKAGMNTEIREYVTNPEWLKTLPAVSLLENHYPPQIGILSTLRKILRNSSPSITTHIIKKALE